VEEDIDGLRLTRYVSGQCTADEAAAIRRWIAAEPSRERVVAELEAAWRAGGQAPYEWGVDEGWRRFDAARRVRNRPSFLLIHGAKRPAPAIVIRDSGTPIWRIAAAVLVIAGASFAVWRAGTPRALSRMDGNAMAEVSTLRGQHATLRLPDGTRVALGMASRLRYARAFGDSARDVYLDGDGYFQVAHDSLHPFAVHTSSSVVRDIGTTFGVRAYSQSAETEVVVSEGTVAFAVDSSQGPMVLSAGSLARLDRRGAHTVLTVTHGVDVSAYLGWTEGRLVFQDTPLNEVIAELRRWYDRDLLELADTSIGSRRLTASFTNESLPIVIDRIALSLDLREERHGQTVVLHPRHH
jgi:transmembrane sensor